MKNVFFWDCFKVCVFVGCLTSQQQASVSQGRICSDSCACCHTEIEVADQTFDLTQSQYTDTGPTGPSAYPITPGAWQGSHWSASLLSHWCDSTPKKSQRKRDSNPGFSALEADTFQLGQRGDLVSNGSTSLLWRKERRHINKIETSSSRDGNFPFMVRNETRLHLAVYFLIFASVHVRSLANNHPLPGGPLITAGFMSA